MPSMPPRACCYRGCSLTSNDGTSYCEKHKPKQSSGWAASNKKRGVSSRHEAGYGHAWDKLRLTILTRDRYLCQPCLKLGVMTMAKQVDHIVNKANGGTNHPTNLQAICFDCHKKKTQKESSSARRVAK